MELIKVTDEYTKSPLARAIPGAYYERDNEWKAYVVDLDAITPRAATVALKLFPTLGVQHPRLNEIRDRLIQNVRPFDNATPYNRTVEAPTVEAALTANGHDFFEYQALDLGYCADILREHGGCYIGWERGLGKTLGACALAEDLGVESMLCVVPNTSKESVWLPEIMQWLDGYFDKLFILPNGKAKRERVMRWVKESRRAGQTVCLVAHYEALSIIAGKSGRGWDQYGTWDMVVADEVHRIKNPKTKMARSLKKIPATYKVAMSGSVIMNHAEELFSVLNWLFPDRYRAKWRDWNDRFLDYVEGYGKICVGIKLERLEALRSELGVFMVYRRKIDELDLPEYTDQPMPIELSAGQRKVYDDLVQQCLAQLEDDSFVIAEEGLPMLVKLRQIATGLDLVGDIHDSSKLDLAAELIADNEDDTFVVFSWFKAACWALAERVGIEKCGVITGDIPQHKRDPIIASFKAGEFPVLIATIGTLGESQNLQVANQSIFIDRSWNPEDNNQARDRIWRIGQDRRVTNTDIIAKDTVDEHRVQPTVTNKEALRRLILGG